MTTPNNCRIQARSEREALDWGLVLASQGIEAIIQGPEEAAPAGWTLIVQEADLFRAQQAISLYRRENRHWPWRRKLPRSNVLFDWGSLGWALLLVFFYWISMTFPLVRQSGLMNSHGVGEGEWWRLFTAVWLHADLTHLSGNASLGLVLCGLAMARFGTGLGLLLICLCGAGGNVLAGVLATGVHQSLGASGMVMGCVGLLAGGSDWRQKPQQGSWLTLLQAAGAGLLIFILIGVDPGSDVVAHLGGCLSGFLMGWGLRRKTGGMGSWADWSAGAMFLGLVIVPWAIAIATTGAPL